MTDNRTIRKRSVFIKGHRTSVSMEDIFWGKFKAIAKSYGMSATESVSAIDEERPNGVNLSSAIRCYVLEVVMSETSPK